MNMIDSANACNGTVQLTIITHKHQHQQQHHHQPPSYDEGNVNQRSFYMNGNEYNYCNIAIDNNDMKLQAI